MKLRYWFPKFLYGGFQDPEEAIGSPQWAWLIFDNMLANVVPTVFPKGNSGTDASLMRGVLVAMDYAVQRGEKHLNLDKTQVEFLKKIFFSDNASVMPTQLRIFCLFKDEIERALAGKEEPDYDEMERKNKGEVGTELTIVKGKVPEPIDGEAKTAAEVLQAETA